MFDENFFSTNDENSDNEKVLKAEDYLSLYVTEYDSAEQHVFTPN